MPFIDTFNQLPIGDLLAASDRATPDTVRAGAFAQHPSLSDFARLISPAGAGLLETLGQRSQQITRQRFGRVIRLFAPLYLSNECINNCHYCGFSRDNPILRVTLSIPDVLEEAMALRTQGFHHVLLVAGEHPKFVSNGYLADSVRALRPHFASVSLEVGPTETADYQPLVEAGADGLVVYQETYNRPVYAEVHTAGPKRNFDWRLATAERAYAAGFRRLGIGALFGLADWRTEALALAAHADWLLRHCWKAQLTISLPRLRPCAGQFEPKHRFSNQDLVQLVCALRITFPDVGIVLSTREPAPLRDGLLPLGITLMSAGSHTEPGGYTGAGKSKLHRTEKGRIVPLSPPSLDPALRGINDSATGQFEIADARSAGEVADRIRQLGYEPVWKDWDAAILN